MTSKILKINSADNVWVALSDLKAGEAVQVNGRLQTIIHDIPAKHKFVERDLPVGGEIIMYGVVVGKALSPIPAGAAITTHNVKHQSASFAGRSKTFHWKAPDVSKWKDKTFSGYHRPDGQVGTANFWIVVPLVFCENRNVGVIKQAFEEELGFGKRNAYKKYVHEMVQLYREGKMESIQQVGLNGSNYETNAPLFKNIDGIKFLTHEGGCGGTRQDAEALCALLAGYMNNPNVAGATVLSLGCQHAQADILREKLKLHNPNFSKPLLLFEQQKEG